MVVGFQFALHLFEQWRIRKLHGTAQGIAQELATELSQECVAARGQVTSITRKPREFMRVTGASLGCPTFSMDGKLVGIAVSRFVRGKTSHNVVIPAADVLEIAQQAREAKPISDEKPKKTEVKKDEK